ncbi:phosphoenolpyruvate hydrolase family protein [Pelagibius sp. 7325]|uniref:phosphoenolpyruvate hydrolase family protein n=1 Tax=Pelagibius sp. 7325 TaxID=3131994 RepID=UPI0030EC7D30
MATTDTGSNLSTRAIPAGSFLIGAAIGSGNTALAAERGGADFLLAINAGRLRNMGAPSIACMLPIFDAGPLTEDFARRELLALCRIPILLGVNVWEAECDPDAIAARVQQMGFAGAVNFPSCMHFSHAMQQLLSRAGRGIEREVEVLRAVQDRGLTSMFYCATRTQARLAADAGLDLICLNLGWNVGGAMGHRTRSSLEEVASAAREIGRLIKRIHPGVRFLLEGGPIVTADDLGRITNLAPIDGYVGGSTIERLPLEVSVADQISGYRQASRRRAALESQSARLVAWGQRFGFVGRAPVQLDYLRRLQGLSGTTAPLLLLLEPGSPTRPSLTALAQRGTRRGRPAVLTIDPQGEDYPAKARRLLFGPGESGAAARPALADDNLDLVVLQAPEQLPTALQRRLAAALRDGTFAALGSRRQYKVAPRLVLVSRGRGSEGAAGIGLAPELALLFEGWTLAPPPLRDRVDDLPALIEDFAEAQGGGLPRRKDFTAAAMKRLTAHDWPQNEAELHNLLGQLAGRRDNGPIQLKQLLPLVQGANPGSGDTRGEKDRIVDALWRHGFNRSRTAESLGMSRKTLYNKMQRFGLRG